MAPRFLVGLRSLAWDCSDTEVTTLEDEDMRDLTGSRNRARVTKSLDSWARLSDSCSNLALLTFTLGTIRTRFIFRFLVRRPSDTRVVRGGVVVAAVLVLLGFMVGMTIRCVMWTLFLAWSTSSTFPPQFFTQFSPLSKLFPFPPHPLNLEKNKYQ